MLAKTIVDIRVPDRKVSPGSAPGDRTASSAERISSRQIRFTASRTPVSGRTVIDIVGIGMDCPRIEAEARKKGS